MAAGRIFGIVVLIGGIVLMFFSHYIMGQVEEGQGKISDAQKKVNQGNELFSLNPYAKEVGKAVVTDPAQKKINMGKEEVAHYTALAYKLKMAGIALIIIGAGFAIFCGTSSKSRR